MNIENYFDDTLQEFYQNSNEIELHSEIFDKNILPELNNYEKLNWLEVGVGKGEKLINHLKGFNTKPNLTIIEPSKVWLDKLDKSGNLIQLQTLCSNITIINSTFEQFNETLTVSDFDYISFNQVIYDNTIFKSLMEFIDSNKNKKNYWLHINLENKTSDLYKLRYKLKKDFPYISTSQLSVITDYLENYNFEFRSFETTNKTLNIDNKKLEYDSSYWFYPFVLGISKGSFDNFNKHLKEDVKSILLNYMKNNNNLEINDTSLLLKIN